MKKSILLFALSMATFTFGQESDDNSSFFSNDAVASGPGTGGGGTDGEDPDPAPIDDYAPLLIAGAVVSGLIVRKKFKKQEN